MNSIFEIPRFNSKSSLLSSLESDKHSNFQFYILVDYTTDLFLRIRHFDSFGVFHISYVSTEYLKKWKNYWLIIFLQVLLFNTHINIKYGKLLAFSTS